MSDLKLPIDVVDARPGVRGKMFRWSYTSDGPTGRKVIPCEGAMQPSAETAITDLIAMAKTLHARLYGKDGALEVAAKLQTFKTWVHAYLDSKGVPGVFPHGSHTKEGCRIGDRLDWLMEQLETAQRRVGELELDTTSPHVAVTEPQPKRRK